MTARRFRLQPARIITHTMPLKDAPARLRDLRSEAGPRDQGNAEALKPATSWIEAMTQGPQGGVGLTQHTNDQALAPNGQETEELPS